MTDNIDWAELTGGGNTPTWDFKNEKEISGEYVQMKGNIGKNNSNLYILKTKKGEVGIWGTSLLNSQFPNISIGTMVKLVYGGKVKNPKTGREYHSFKIYLGKQK